MSISSSIASFSAPVKYFDTKKGALAFAKVVAEAEAEDIEGFSIVLAPSGENFCVVDEDGEEVGNVFVVEIVPVGLFAVALYEDLEGTTVFVTE